MRITEIKLTMKSLEEHAEKCLQENKDLTVLIEMPGFPEPEFITNPPQNVKKKMEYYKATYDENCNHKHAKGIRIVAVSL